MDLSFFTTMTYGLQGNPLQGLNNAITDGGVAPPEILLTIVMMSSNLKSLRISINSKDSREG